MKEVILNAKHHIKALLGYLKYCDIRFDGMEDAQAFLDRLEKWESLKPAEQAKRENWIKIGTFTVAELIGEEGEENEESEE